jgi:hypothetical protein
MGTNGTVLPPISSYFGSEWEEGGEEAGNALIDPFCPRPQPNHRASISCAPLPLEQRQPRKRKGHSFWRLTSPPIVESAIPELDRGEEGEEPSSRDVAIPEPKSGGRTARMSMEPGPSTTSPPVTGQQLEANAEIREEEGDARLDALHTLEGTHGKGGRSQNSDKGWVSSHSEENPITMCGKRLYSDWTGHWGRLILSSPFKLRSYLPICTEGVPRKILGAGALFPEGYLPRIGDPNPWICPVRDCQTIFAEVWALGGHFSVS